jgi:hypothetical protein
MHAAPLDLPALPPAMAEGEPGIGRLETPGRPDVMVEFRDLSWRRCRLLAWQRDRAPGVWWCLLRWSVSGQSYQGWYAYDMAKVAPRNSELLHPMQHSHGCAMLCFRRLG